MIRRSTSSSRERAALARGRAARGLHERLLRPAARRPPGAARGGARARATCWWSAINSRRLGARAQGRRAGPLVPETRARGGAAGAGGGGPRGGLRRAHAAARWSRRSLPDVLVKGADWARGRDRGPRGGGGRRRARGARGARARAARRPRSSSASGSRERALARSRSARDAGPARAARGRWPRRGACALARPHGHRAAARARCCSASAPLLVVVPRERDVERARRRPADARRARPAAPGAVLPSPPRARRPSAACRATPRPRCARAAALHAARSRPAARRGGLARRPAAADARAASSSRRASSRLRARRGADARDPARGARRRRLPARGSGDRRPARWRAAAASSTSSRPTGDEPVRIEFFGDTLESLRALRPRDPAHARRALDAARGRCRSPTSSRTRSRAGRAARARCPSASRTGASCRRSLERLERGPACRTRLRRAAAARARAPRCPPGSTSPASRWSCSSPEAVRRGGRGLPRARARGARPPPRTRSPLEPDEALRRAGGAARAPGRRPALAAARGGSRRARRSHVAAPAGRAATRATCARWPPTCARRAGRTRPLPGQRRARRPPERRAARGRPRASARRRRVEVRVGALSARLRAARRRACACWPTATSSPRRCTSTRAAARGGPRSFLSDFRDLKVGDLVVHQDHGIGRFQGLETLEIGGARARVHGARLPGRRQAQGAGRGLRPRPEVRERGGRAARRSTGWAAASWEKVKRASRRPCATWPRSCCKLYAERKARPGHAFTGESPWQREFEEAFEYEETPDQAAAIADVAADMARDVAHGPAGLRRRGLRQDRGGDARGHARRARRQAGGGAGAHHRARLPALEDLPQALRALPGAGRDGLALPRRRRRSRRCWPRTADGQGGHPDRHPPPALARTWSSATWACWSSTRSSASASRPRRS